MPRLFIVIFAIALTVASTGHAQPSPDQAALAAAHKYLEVTRTAETMKALIPGARRGIFDVLAKANPGIVVEVEKAVDELVMPEFLSRLPELLNTMAELIALHFSADELQRINAFYETPEGIKLAQVSPTLAVQGQRIGAEWGRRVAIDTLTKTAPKLRERGIKNL